MRYLIPVTANGHTDQTTAKTKLKIAYTMGKKSEGSNATDNKARHRS
jgi:hypothetical protein